MTAFSLRRLWQAAHIFPETAQAISMFRTICKVSKNFISCGAAGWCLEISWTCLDAWRRKDPKLKGVTSAWMFPIYGCAAFFQPLFQLLRTLPVPVRGSLYSLAIFAAEYTSGSCLSRSGRCPWDYSRCRFHIRGLIRLDYFFVWFLTGLLFERLLTRKTHPSSPFPADGRGR